jgi:hypothetical protein
MIDSKYMIFVKYKISEKRESMACDLLNPVQNEKITTRGAINTK